MSVTNTITERTITGVNESEDLFLDNSSSTVNNTGIVERDIEASHDANFVHPLGDELVTNGDFATDSDWEFNTGWSMGDGVAVGNASIGTGSIYQQGIFEIGKIYQLKLDATLASGSFKLEGSGGFALATFNETKSYNVIIEATQVDLMFRRSTSSFIGSIDNISVKEILVNRESTVNNTGTVERGIEGINESEDLFLDNSSSTVTNTGVTIRDVEGVNESEAMFPDNTSSDILNIGESILPLLKNLEDRAEYYENEENTIESLSSNRADLLSKASLIMTPTAYSDGELHSVKPIDGVGDFNFSRNSSATRINEQGLIEEVGNNIPRIDYSSGEGALKLEPQSTNLLAYSEDFSNAAWTKSNSTITSNSIISPDGTLNASTLTESSTSGVHLFTNPIVNTNGLVWGSIYAKYLSRYLRLTIHDTSNSNEWYSVIYDLQNGTIYDSLAKTVTVFDSKIEKMPNGYYRCIIAADLGASSTTILYVQTSNGASIVLGDDRGRGQYQGDGTSGIYVWGAQIEAGSHATSYIPTQGSAVTRLADLSDTQNLSHVIGQTEGVIFYDAILVHKSTSTSEDLFELSIDNGSNQNIFFINNYNNALIVGLNNGGSNQFYNNSYNPTEGARYKLAFAYKQNDFALYINGNQIATAPIGTVPAMNQITFGNYYNNQFNLANSVKINDFKLYNTRLSNSELAALTQV